MEIMNIEFRYEQGESKLYQDGKEIISEQLIAGSSETFKFVYQKLRKEFENVMGQLNMGNETTPKAKMSLDLIMEIKEI